MSFEEKKNLLFSSLESAEQGIGTDSILHQNVKEIDYSLDRSNKTRTKLISVDRYRGRESIFKRPNAPIGQCLKRTHVPDYKRNPHKWIKYTLEDVDTSDRTNMAAAFSFLKQMEEQREASLQDETDQQNSTQSQPGTGCRALVRFNRSVRLREQLQEADDPVETPAEERPQFNGRRVLMPEYVVGQRDPKKVKRTKRPVKAGEGKQNELQLDHLMEENEDDDEEDGQLEV
ncbi:AGAP005409-PA-like protein [Anopheles sinensis]|uniref:U5 small nuclear ribonucleoprotein TSSC4 n=1 Tax=Anopheles sinensis TaxID=74873 RepID=A0A084WD99_ANOSI|nr:AGAP005409-PA-like protein [Anopheles sinensis]